jgi:hypothetical protein
VKIFVETTIPSYLVSRPARDLVQMARQQTTRDWWEACRGLRGQELILDIFNSCGAHNEAVLAADYFSAFSPT